MTTTRPISLLGASLPFALIGAIELAARWFGLEDLALFTKPLLMPTLALVPALAAPKGAGSLRRLLYAGLALSWAGDVFLMWDGLVAFAAGLGSFLLAHIAYVALFVRGLRGRVSSFAFVYLAGYVGMIVLLAPHVGPLLLPVLAYGAVLAVMAALATRGGPALAAGGALFMISDGILAAGRFLPDASIPRVSFLVMLTYLAAQALIATSMTRRLRELAAT